MRYFLSGKGPKTKYYATLGDVQAAAKYGDEIIGEKVIHGKTVQAYLGSIERDAKGICFLKNRAKWMEV